MRVRGRREREREEEEEESEPRERRGRSRPHSARPRCCLPSSFDERKRLQLPDYQLRCIQPVSKLSRLRLWLAPAALSGSSCDRASPLFTLQLSAPLQRIRSLARRTLVGLGSALGGRASGAVLAKHELACARDGVRMDRGADGRLWAGTAARRDTVERRRAGEGRETVARGWPPLASRRIARCPCATVQVSSTCWGWIWMRCCCGRGLLGDEHVLDLEPIPLSRATS